MDYIPASDWRTQQWRTPSWIGETDECWIHHGASGSPTLATLRAYERYHVLTLGWYALGYSWAVTRDGTIYEGRGWHRAGAHTSGRNSVSHAILLVGDWSSGTVPPAMIDAAARVIRHGRDTGALTGDCTIGGHREAPDQSTSCPGAAGMRAVGQIRDRVDQGEESWFDMASKDELRDVVREVVREEVARQVWGYSRGDDERDMASLQASGGLRVDELGDPHETDQQRQLDEVHREVVR